MKNFCVAYQPLASSCTESFLAYIFCFPNSDHVIFSREFAFSLFIDFACYVICTKTEQFFSFLWGIITRLWENKDVQAKKLELLTTTKMETKTIAVTSNSSVRAYIYIYITIFRKISKMLCPSLLTAEPFSTFLLRTRTPKYATFYWRREHRATRHHELIF